MIKSMVIKFEKTNVNSYTKYYRDLKGNITGYDRIKYYKEASSPIKPHALVIVKKNRIEPKTIFFRTKSEALKKLKSLIS